MSSQAAQKSFDDLLCSFGEQAAPAVEQATEDRRRGEDSRLFEHYCEHPSCRRWGAFGYGVRLAQGRVGNWYCGEHRPGIEAGGAA